MDYTLCSDLHLSGGHETSLTSMHFEKLVLIGGDTTDGLSATPFFEKMKRKGHDLLAVDGNHEHYRNGMFDRSLLETERMFFSVQKALFGRSLLDGPVRLRDDLYVIGRNGWYVIHDEDHWRSYMPDDRRGLSAKEINEAARRHAHEIGEQLVALPYGAKAIVLTHTAPCMSSLDPAYDGSDGNDYFWNPLLAATLRSCSDLIAVWHHGHTHHVHTVEYHGVRVQTNPRGTPRESSGWKTVSLSI